MKGSSLLRWCLLVPVVALGFGCSSSQVVDDETAAEMALDEAGEPSKEEALSESELAARKFREEEAAKGEPKEEAPKKTGGLTVLPAVEREGGEDEESDPDDVDLADDGGGSGDELPDDSVGGIDPDAPPGVYDEDE